MGTRLVHAMQSMKPVELYYQTSVVISSQVQHNDIRKKKHSATIAAWPMGRSGLPGEIQCLCLMVDSKTMFARLLYQYVLSSSTNFSSDTFKSQIFLQILSNHNFTSQCNPIFHTKCQIRTSVLMSRAIHEAFYSWVFPGWPIILKKTWRFFSSRHY